MRLNKYNSIIYHIYRIVYIVYIHHVYFLLLLDVKHGCFFMLTHYKTSRTHTYSLVKVRVTGERTGGGTSCHSCCIGLMSRGAGFPGRREERLLETQKATGRHTGTLTFGTRTHVKSKNLATFSLVNKWCSDRCRECQMKCILSLLNASKWFLCLEQKAFKKKPLCCRNTFTSIANI